MNVGDKILELRKSKGYSQEDIANKLNVSRQTISKWETNQSTPDFDKIVPLCQLFGITTDELLMNKVVEKENVKNDVIQEDNNLSHNFDRNRRKHAFSICVSTFLYFLSVMVIIFFEAMGYNDELSVVLFLGIAGLATVILIYSCMVNRIAKEELRREKEVNQTVKSINNILALVFLVIYMVISFATMAWYITWILWIVYAVVTEIVSLIFKLGEKSDE